MSETLTTPPQEEHELDKKIRKAENKLGQKVLNKLFNFKDAGQLVATKEVINLHAVRDADEANEHFRDEYTDAYYDEKTLRPQLDREETQLHQIQQDRNEAAGESVAYEDLTEAHQKLRDEEYASIVRTEDALSTANEFYVDNKDKLHEAALYDAKTAGVDVKTSNKS